MIDLVALGRMGGVQLAPVGLRAVIGHLGVPEVQLIAAPVDGDSRIAVFGIGDHAIQTGRLAAAVHFQDGGQFGSAFGEGIERGHFHRHPFEDTDLIAKQPTNNAVIFPILQDFNFQRFQAGVVIPPEFIQSGRSLAILQRGQRVVGADPRKPQQYKQGNAG